MRYFPAFLDLSGKSVIIFGGGEVALRKARSLIAARAKVTVVAPESHPALKRFKGVRLISRGYRPGDLARQFLAVAATDDPKVQQAIRREATRRRVLLNVADCPKLCDFIYPAVVRRGDFCIAISTGGASPILARRVRERLEKMFGPEYGRRVARLKRSGRR